MGVLSDMRHALRLLVRNPGFSLATLVTVALGVGGTAAVFAVVYGVLLRPLPYPDPAELVRVWEVHPGANAPFPGALLSNATYHTWMERRETLAELGTYRPVERAVTGPGATGRIGGASVTPSLFRLLRTGLEYGRLFTDEDTQDGADPVVLLTYDAWQRRYGGEADVLGRELRLEDTAHAIVGIVARDFELPEMGYRSSEFPVEFYLPLAVAPVSPDTPIQMLPTMARLQPFASAAQAATEGTVIARAVERPFAALIFGDGDPVDVRVMPLVQQLTNQVRPALLIVTAGVGLVLLVAAANVANLLLSRNSARAAELGIRTALGASRRRLARQLLTESGVVSLLGGGLGVVVGWVLARAVPRLAPADFPRLGEVQVDAGFFLTALGASVAVAGAAGVRPAVRQSTSPTMSARQVGSTPAMTRLRQSLLVVEAAVSVVLVVGSLLLARSLVALLDADTGYDPSNVLVATLHHPSGASDDGQYDRVIDGILERLRATPGVEAAGAGNMSPFGDRISSLGFGLPGLTAPDGAPRMLRALSNEVTPGYAEALGIRLVEGRFFDERDPSASRFPFLVNETFVATYFDDGRPVVGRQYAGVFPGQLGRDDAVGEVAGVVGDVLLTDLDGQPQPQLYFPVGQSGITLRRASIVVRTTGNPSAMTRTLVSVVEEVDPAATVSHLGPLSGRLTVATAEPRFFTFVVTAFSALSVALATAGLYGVLAYSFRRRRRELGVRLALGATRGDLTAMVVRHGLGPTTLGVAAGLVISALAGRTLSSVLFGVTPYDVVAFTAAPLFLLMVASIACLIAAHQVTAIDAREALASD